jgi:hypothetical protein
MVRPVLRSLTLAALLAPGLALAHHGTRFLLAVEYDMPDRPFLILDGGWSRFRDGDVLELHPGVLFPVGSDHMSAFEVHAHIAKIGSESLTYEATGFEFRHRFTKGAGWNFAGSLEYEAAATSDEENNWTATAIAGRENANGILLLNLLAGKPIDAPGRPNWAYRAAWSPTPKTETNYSLELQGSLEKDGSHEILVGAMKHLNPDTMVKFGVGTGLTSDSPRLSLRFGLVHALK